MTPTPTVSQIMASMKSFLTAVMPDDVVVVQGQPNRVAEPDASRFIVMSPPRFSRLETNVDSSEDAIFTGSIAGMTLTITAVDPRFPEAILDIGSVLWGSTIAAGTTVTAFASGSGQVGTYRVNNFQTVAEGTISAGMTSVQMNAIATVQLDFHASDETSSDLANVVSALMRDTFAMQQFANQSPAFAVVPLYADDAAQRPFFNDQQQIEWRWVVEALLQANIVIVVPQQFADLATLTLNSVFAQVPSPIVGLTTDLTNPGNEIIVPLILTGV